MSEKRCFHCMKIMTDTVCSCEESKKERGIFPNALKPGTQLKNELISYRYVVGHVMGDGGFGIVYVAWDETEGRKVAIKELFPCDEVRRSASDFKKVIHDAGKESEWEARKNKVLSEVGRLAKFEDEEHIVSVVDHFTENNTVYIVMKYINGVTLQSYLGAKGVFTETQICSLMRPVLESLARVHQKGIIHRDISPDNLMISMDERGNSSLTLIDFGAANEGNSSRVLSRVFKRYFSPIEIQQGKDIGTWSDIYSLCATMYYCLTGQIPMDAEEREDSEEELKRPGECPQAKGPFSENFERALMKGLSFSRVLRQQTIEELMADFGMQTASVGVAGTAVPVTEKDSKEESNGESVKAEECRGCPAEVRKEADSVTVTTKGKKRKSKRNVLIAGIIFAVLLVVGLGVIWAGNRDGYKDDSVRENFAEVSESENNERIPKAYKKAFVLENVVVTYDLLASSIGKGTETIAFKGCSFEKGALKAFDVAMSKLSSVEFVDCTGADYGEIDFSAYESLMKLTFINSGVDDICANAFVGSEKSIDKVRYLVIREPEVTDCSFISKFGNVYLLDICSNTLDIKSGDVGDTCGIRYLRLGGYSEKAKFSADTIEALSRMSSLNYVKFENVLIPEELEEQFIPMFAGLKYLEGVDVSNCNLKSLNLLSGAGQLKSLVADNNELTDLDALERLIRLEELSVCNNGLTDISGLKNCTVLRKVCLRSNNIADISVLTKSAGEITVLDVSENALLFGGEDRDAVLLNKTTIGGLQKLSRLNISNIGCVDDTLALNAPNLSVLHADGCGLESVTNTAGYDNLTFVDISNNKISDEAVIGNFKKVSTLIASNNAFTSLGNTRDLQVKNLILTGNSISVMPTFRPGYGINILIDYHAELNEQRLGAIAVGYAYITVNNVPLDKQVGYEKVIKYSLTFDENQTETEKYSLKLKSNSINEMFTVRFNNLSDVELVKE